MLISGGDITYETVFCCNFKRMDLIAGSPTFATLIGFIVIKSFVLYCFISIIKQALFIMQLH